MDVSDLRIFEAVARLGSMNRASSELNTVQSNVTARIRHLEVELATQLFTRHRHGVILTEAGSRLVPYALRARRLLDEAKRSVRETSSPSGTLTLGSLETTAAHRLSPILAKYGRRFPEVDLVLRTATNAQLVADVLEERVEGAFVCGPVVDRRLAYETIFAEELVIATATGIPSWQSLCRQGALKIAVKPPGCCYRERLEQFLSRQSVIPRRMEFGTLEAVLNCVASGLAATLLPRSVVAPAERAGRLRTHDLATAEANVHTIFVQHREAAPSSALKAFLDVLLRNDAEAVAD